jgi:TldD protein
MIHIEGLVGCECRRLTAPFFRPWEVWFESAIVCYNPLDRTGPGTRAMDNREDYFGNRFGVSAEMQKQLLSTALARGGEYADLYFEYRIKDTLAMEESILKNSSTSVTMGVGIRVISGERTGYAYADSFDEEDMLKAAVAAGAIALAGGADTGPFRAGAHPVDQDLYPVARPLAEFELAPKIRLLEEADRAARRYDSRVAEVRVVLANETKRVLFRSSEGDPAFDTQPLTVFQVSCIASDGKQLQVGIKGGGGRIGLDFFESRSPSYFAREAARRAVLLLQAEEVPAGPMPVVLGPGWPGILLHEAIGHGLEADFNRKGLSAFSGRIGQKVASELCTVVDDGTLPYRRGSLNFDDEGNPTERTILIEKGILRGYMHDSLSAKLMHAAPTGNGRRESYAFPPLPRMTNTFMLAGKHTGDEILRSVNRGLYAVSFGGGQVDITSGKFVFTASEAYLIEGGRVTAPVKGATLIGNGPDILTRVSMVGSDLELDEGVGTCGKAGQNVPVGVGMPMVRVDEITVGGTRSQAG